MTVKMEQEDLEILNEFQDVSIKIKKLEEARDFIKDDVIEILEDYSLTKFEGDIGTISYTRASQSTGIDSKKLKAELPDIADQYAKVSSRKASLKFKINEVKE